MDRHVSKGPENTFILRETKWWCWGSKSENVRLSLGKLVCQKKPEGFLDKGEMAKKACGKKTKQNNP